MTGLTPGAWPSVMTWTGLCTILISGVLTNKLLTSLCDHKIIFITIQMLENIETWKRNLNAKRIFLVFCHFSYLVNVSDFTIFSIKDTCVNLSHTHKKVHYVLDQSLFYNIYNDILIFSYFLLVTYMTW